MKNIIFSVLTIFLIGCQQPTQSAQYPPVVTPTQTVTSGSVVHTVIIKNSKWQDVPISTVSPARSLVARDSVAGADLQSVQTAVETYNIQTIDNMYFLYVDEQAPDLDAAPLVTVYVCNPLTGNVNSTWNNITRRSLVDHYDGWKTSFPSETIYIDHVPPPPVQDSIVNPYAFYAITIKDSGTGKIVLVDHCGYNPDQSFMGQWILTPEGQFYNGTPGGGWASIESYWDQRLRTFNQIAGSPYTTPDNVLHTNMSVITRQVYVEPTEALP